MSEYRCFGKTDGAKDEQRVSTRLVAQTSPLICNPTRYVRGTMDFQEVLAKVVSTA
jgi:hypothetical protein